MILWYPHRWVLMIVTPVIRGTGKRFGCNIVSAINNRGKMRFMVFKGGFNQDRMIEFLDRLIRDAKRKGDKWFNSGDVVRDPRA